VPTNVVDSDTSTIDLNNGKLQAGDTITATFSEAIASGLVTPTSITESRTITGNAFLTIGGFTNGALDMGSALYVAIASVTFSATGATSTPAKTVTITAGSLTSGILSDLGQGLLGGGMDYVPAPTLLDAAGNAATGSFHTSSPVF